MAGQPNVFDFAVITATETPARAPQIPPYFIVEAGDTLNLEPCFHCGGDKTTRDHLHEAMNNAAPAPSVTYYFQDLQGGPAIPSIVQGPPPSPPPVDPLAQPDADALFKGAGSLKGSTLDPTDDYYVWNPQPINTSNFAAPGIDLVVVPGVTGTWRLLLVFYGVDATGQIITAFDDSMIIQVIG